VVPWVIPLFATKSVDKLRSDAEYGYGLKRSLTAFDLVLLGVGGIIGTGIFVLTGRAAAANAGPAVALSFTSPPSPPPSRACATPRWRP
jgi:APA family basic amino acid/polyamine antiporter